MDRHPSTPGEALGGNHLSTTTLGTSYQAATDVGCQRHVEPAPQPLCPRDKSGELLGNKGCPLKDFCDSPKSVPVIFSSAGKENASRHSTPTRRSHWCAVNLGRLTGDTPQVSTFLPGLLNLSTHANQQGFLCPRRSLQSNPRVSLLPSCITTSRITCDVATSSVSAKIWEAN